MNTKPETPESILVQVEHTHVSGTAEAHVYQDLSLAVGKRVKRGQMVEAVKSAHPDATVIRYDGVIIAFGGAVPHSEENVE